MTKLSTSVARAAAIATLVGGVTLAGATFAAPLDSTAPAGPPNSSVNFDSQGDVTGSTPDTDAGRSPEQMAAPAPAMHHEGMHHHSMMQESPADMKKHVEMRIKMLHDKLMITQAQEPAWNDVANAMRNNENAIAGVIAERQQNAGSMTAVDDMESYQKVAQAHADGFSKVIASFKTLYSAMPAAQQKNADKVFANSYEGHHGHHMMHHKKVAK